MLPTHPSNSTRAVSTTSHTALQKTLITVFLLLATELRWNYEHVIRFYKVFRMASTTTLSKTRGPKPGETTATSKWPETRTTTAVSPPTPSTQSSHLSTTTASHCKSNSTDPATINTHEPSSSPSSETPSGDRFRSNLFSLHFPFFLFSAQHVCRELAQQYSWFYILSLSEIFCQFHFNSFIHWKVNKKEIQVQAIFIKMQLHQSSRRKVTEFSIWSDSAGSSAVNSVIALTTKRKFA